MRRPTEASHCLTVDAPVPTLAIMNSSLGQKFYRFVTFTLATFVDA
jgi:hypothetical protein